MSQIELKPCPFCDGARGKPDLSEHETQLLGTSYRGHCKCGVHGPGGLTKDEAIAKWNTRSLPSGVMVDREDVEAIVAAMKDTTKPLGAALRDRLRSAIGGGS